MKSKYLNIFILSVSILAFSSLANAHCEIPCGIYDDEARIALILEHVTTIEKSMASINQLQNEKTLNYNQLVRWISNKEEHANKIQEIVTQYFLTQRIKPGTDQYTEKLTLLHKMLLLSMKCKQTTDSQHTKSLTAAVAAFEQVYFSKH